MSVVHLWFGRGGTWSLDTGLDKTWCQVGVRRGELAVGDDEIKRVTCPSCLGIASDFGGACLARWRELDKATGPAWVGPLLERLDAIARREAVHGALPLENSRRIAQLATVVAELVKHIASKERT